MARFQAPVEYKRTRDSGDRGFFSRFAGMPVGVQLIEDWVVHNVAFRNSTDLPVNATNWVITLVGTGTVALSDNIFPPHLIFANSNADNDSIELQFSHTTGVGSWGLLTGDRPIYFETMLRFRDPGNVDAAVEEMEFFVGLCVTDTTVQAGATDFVGFRKRDLTDDATGRINFVSGKAGGGAGLLVDQLVSATGWVALDPVENLVVDRQNKRLGANQWLKLAFLVEPQGSGAAGRAYVWVNDVLSVNSPVNLGANVPDAQLCITMAFQNGEAAVIKQMDCAGIIVAQSLYDDTGVMI